MGYVLKFSAMLIFAVGSFAQSPARESGTSPEISVVLEPELTTGDIPLAFIFHLTNVSNVGLYVPQPNIDCMNETENGSVWLNESWQEPNGEGIGKGAASCDFGSPGLPSAPIAQRASRWRVLNPGDSLFIHATSEQLHYEVREPGLYVFSAVYIPPDLSVQQVRDLTEAGIRVPRTRVTSPKLVYRLQQR